MSRTVLLANDNVNARIIAATLLQIRGLPHEPRPKRRDALGLPGSVAFIGLPEQRAGCDEGGQPPRATVR